MNRKTILIALVIALDVALAAFVGAPPIPSALGTAVAVMVLVLTVEFVRPKTPRGNTLAGLVALLALVAAALWPWALWGLA